MLEDMIVLVLLRRGQKSEAVARGPGGGFARFQVGERAGSHQASAIFRSIAGTEASFLRPILTVGISPRLAAS